MTLISAKRSQHLSDSASSGERFHRPANIQGVPFGTYTTIQWIDIEDIEIIALVGYAQLKMNHI